MNRDDVRRLLPTVVAFADECREVFGDGVKLVYAKENGREIGAPSEVDPGRVVKLSEMVAMGTFVPRDIAVNEDCSTERRVRRGK